MKRTYHVLWITGTVLTLFLQVAAAQGPMISEFMASNSRFQDADADTPDWIEVYNPTAQVADLGGWFLTDDPDNLLKWRIPAGFRLNPGQYRVIFASDKDQTDPAAELHTNFRLNREQGFVALVEPDGVTIAGSFAYGPQFRDISYGTSSMGGTIEDIVLFSEGSLARALIPENDTLGLDWTGPGFDDSLWDVGHTGIGYDYGDLIGLDVGAMRNVNSSIYCRIPFEIETVADITQLTLRLQYEDGFVAYLNGVPVAAGNAPNEEQLTWNSSATATREDADAVRFAEFVLPTDSIDALVRGENILAIHGLNANPGSSDLLVLPELIARRMTNTNEQQNTTGYFTVPTPGKSNSPVSVVLGPGIFDVTAAPDPPTENQDLLITARVEKTTHPIVFVGLFVMVNFSDNLGGQLVNPATMSDDGTGVDAVAGDGIYSVSLPAALYQPGDMLRWAVIAYDAQGRETRNPPLLTDVESDEYYGTVIHDPAVHSQLPVIQWFVENVGASETDGGTRGSVYYLDEFYDNVIIHRRGGSTAGQPKTHFKINFNPGRKFRFDPDEGRVNEINLNSPYSDKAYLRQSLAFEAYDWCGCPGSISFPIVGYRNGDFFGVQILIEEPEEELLEREGLDPDGALYKMYNEFTFGSGEKKTRRWEGNQDLQNFVNQINNTFGQELHNNIMDMVDLPRTLNYLAATVLVHQNDHPHKNHYLYRDSDGSGQWFFLPWDHDLTWGSNWTGSSYHDYIYADDDQVPGKPEYIKPSHPFVGKQDCQEWNFHWNRLIDALLEDDMVREMYLRRLRTIMDEFLQPPGTPYDELFIENRIDDLAALMAADVQRDYSRWADPWPWGGQGGYDRDQTFTEALAILKEDYLAVRREHLFVTHNVDRADEYDIPGSYSALIPNAQPAFSVIEFGDLEVSPASHNQDEEYIELVNPNSYAVDMSYWQLIGAVEHTFLPGTVIVGHGSLYVSPNAGAFFNRSVSPRRGEGHFVQGDYKGHLSNRGETLTLLDRYGARVSTVSYDGTPSQQQQAVRISELMYHPAEPPDDIVADAEELEFIELLNVSDTPVSLNGLRFTVGIDFTFPDVTLSAGDRIVLAKNPDILADVYSLTTSSILGPYQGQLDNGGETLKLEDNASNTILEFSYDDAWYIQTDGLGFSLVVIDPFTIGPNDYSAPISWQASSTLGGTPGSE